MNITWYGQTCFKIEIKSQNEDISIVTDPFDDEATGLSLPRKLTADIVLQKGDKLVYPVETHEGKKPFVISKPGEYEIKGVFIYSMPLAQEGHVFWIDAEHIVILHAGAISRVPDISELQTIDNVDILTVPIGGNGVLDAKDASKLIKEIEPRIVIPSQYKIKGIKQKLDGIEEFTKIIGDKIETLPKLKIQRKDLPVDERKVILLEKI